MTNLGKKDTTSETSFPATTSNTQLCNMIGTINQFFLKTAGKPDNKASKG